MVFLLHMLHVLTIIITINYSELYVSNHKTNLNSNPNHYSKCMKLINITQYSNV